MKTVTSLASLALVLPALAQGGSGGKPKCKKYVTSEALQELITLDDLLAGSQKLQDFADAHGGNRAFGSGGHNATVDWLYDTLDATGYYDVVKQPFVELFASASAELTVGGKEIENRPMTYTPGGSGTGKLVYVEGFGCTAAEFPAEVKGNVVILSRGQCSFGSKAVNAKVAGVTTLLVYNNEPGMLSGTLGDPYLDYAPALGITQEDGQAIVASLKAGEEVAVEVDVDALVEDRVNYNVIAETKKGDHDNVLVLGGHSDSVPAGPGINDDGSGTIGVLNTALALTKFRIKNAVRFAFWGAEEFGKLGSYYYVMQLNQSDTELAKMRAYLNFDMIASPNYVYGIYDGDGSAFNFTGPAGSDVLEADFEEFYEANGQAHVPSLFTYRSDYAAFIENGIPSGGIFTGAEVLKTEEEAKLFGGEAGVAYDVNYHLVGDNMDNLNLEAYLLNAKSIAHTVAKYAMSWETLPPVDIKQRRSMPEQAEMIKRDHPSIHARGHGHSHAHKGPCGGADAA
ncbi:hypothetical protein NLU13_9614 [Sarocladium strictum]|uniref:Peptide hydrolase n=1 Tax=Sarocladium strictum TaxID=5046 RepID=A0AA39L4C8_SARSR|nr:hypothetical protein NLU13_9614 [Sarocladium strictum]